MMTYRRASIDAHESYDLEPGVHVKDIPRYAAAEIAREEDSGVGNLCGIGIAPQRCDLRNLEHFRESLDTARRCGLDGASGDCVDANVRWSEIAREIADFSFESG